MWLGEKSPTGSREFWISQLLGGNHVGDPAKHGEKQSQKTEERLMSPTLTQPTGKHGEQPSRNWTIQPHRVGIMDFKHWWWWWWRIDDDDDDESGERWTLDEKGIIFQPLFICLFCMLPVLFRVNRRHADRWSCDRDGQPGRGERGGVPSGVRALWAGEAAHRGPGLEGWDHAPQAPGLQRYISCCGAVVAQWIRPQTLNSEVPGSNLPAGPVVPWLGKALYPHFLVSWKRLIAIRPLVACL